MGILFAKPPTPEEMSAAKTLVDDLVRGQKVRPEAAAYTSPMHALACQDRHLWHAPPCRRPPAVTAHPPPLPPRSPPPLCLFILPSNATDVQVVVFSKTYCECA